MSTPDERRAEMNRVRIRLAKNLRRVEDLYLELHWQAMAKHSDRDFPGGIALSMLGPVADPEAFGYRTTSAALGRIGRMSDDDVIDSEKHPLYVLESWTRIVRDERDQPTGLSATVSREVDYLRKSIDWCTAMTEDGEAEWFEVYELDDALRSLVRTMEDVLLMGERPERTRVPCINVDCYDKPRLVKIWRSKVLWDCYRCPSCRREYDKDQFNKAKEEWLASSSAERFVLVSEAMKAVEVPKSTVDSWIRRMKIRAACDLATKRVHVWWPDVRDMARERRARKAS